MSSCLISENRQVYGRVYIRPSNFWLDIVQYFKGKHNLKPSMKIEFDNNALWKEIVHDVRSSEQRERCLREETTAFNSMLYLTNLSQLGPFVSFSLF